MTSPDEQPERYSRPAVTVELTAGEKMLALRMLRSVKAPHRVHRLLDQETLWAHEAAQLAGLLFKAAGQARPLSRDRRQASRLARRYRAAADAARRAPINPTEWPEAPHKHPVPPLTWDEATATARWAVIPPPF